MAKTAEQLESIRIRGARQNNLKGFDLDLPLGKLIVVTGLSGAGKSSLVFETLHAEGQRRYVETFSPYTRQFLEMMDRPQVDSIENIRPSIAIEQRNTVRTSRSTVGTMTELCDYFKVWFAHGARLIDPATGEPIEDDSPATIWKKVARAFAGRRVLLAFRVRRGPKLPWKTVLDSLAAQGYTRAAAEGRGLERIDALRPEDLGDRTELAVVQDRLKIAAGTRNRFLEAAATALHFGKGQLEILDESGTRLAAYSEGLHSPETGERYRPAVPNLFSFNSPLGACPRCRGFGRIITIDDRLVIPDTTLSLKDGAIRAFQGAVYSESQRDILRACRKHGVPADVAWREMTEAQRAFVMDGEPGYGEDGREWPQAWYGVRRFFEWLEGNTYKMHVRVFLSKYRAYVTCPDCKGTRLIPEALLWKWEGRTLPDLYRQPVSELLPLLESKAATTGDKRVDVALDAILTRLRYLESVGVGYLTLDRSSRSLSGGETQRVSLTTCLGTSLVDTLFVLDEPSIGLHARDIDRLIGILRSLTAPGNTVVVVEHDEAVMRAADLIVDIGPEPGAKGGRIVAMGPPAELAEHPESVTGAYLSGRKTVPPPAHRRSVRRTKAQAWLRIEGAAKHNLDDFSAKIPLGRFVALSGVSGSGKSTLLDNVIHQGLLARAGKAVDDPAAVRSIEPDHGFGEIVLVDQSPASRTPRSNPVLFVDAWNHIRQLFARTDDARSRGFTASHFSFNSGHGRCPTCEGLGYEKIEMQFMADVYVPCPTCGGRRFAPEVLAVQWAGKSAADILDLTVDEALLFFAREPRVRHRLESLAAVGLGYLTLGQPLNTLSGGESQRLKLVKYLSRFGGTVDRALILLDEPTTGLHREDVKRLLAVLQQLVDLGHSLIVIEHQTDVLAAADWILELGPGAGAEGGRFVFEGTPARLAKAKTETAPYLRTALDPAAEAPAPPVLAAAAEDPAPYGTAAPSANGSNGSLLLTGAREHNLKNLTIEIPRRALTVVTGVSGSGKSSLAFDIIFAESQRRFMESMSAWARQYVEQLPRPDIDELRGIPPAVAIEQRVTRGTRKSTVATITEVAQYLRLLYARIGVPCSPVTGEPLVSLTPGEITAALEKTLAKSPPKAGATHFLLAPLVRGRKGHHQPLADWARAHGYTRLRTDGALVETDRFTKLDRYREHDVEVAVAHIARAGRSRKPAFTVAGEAASPAEAVETALRIGKGACLLVDGAGREIAWFSTKRTDPATGLAFPELDPKHFSWNSARGWCPTCRGHGRIYPWMAEDERFEDVPEDAGPGDPCPACEGTRLGGTARSVYLFFKNGPRLNLPGLLALTSDELMERLRALRLDAKGRAVARDVIPEVEERLKFMRGLGLDYLTLDRATNTLSGGEAQRIRLAAQLGSNLSGVLYVLDEPSIGLHARDNARLIDSLRALREKGNTLLVVEHDIDTMRAADCIIDLGPGAGRHGGELLACGRLDEIAKIDRSLTGRYLHNGMPHPLRGARRPLPPAYHARRKTAPDEWCVLEQPALRNLKGGVLLLPKSRLTVVCGISGAGKSTLVRDLLRPGVETAVRAKSARLAGARAGGLAFKRLLHGHTFRQAIEVDQSPIGKTPRSTPATYTGAFDIIRAYFGNLPEAKMRGYSPGTFSFNTKGGRCESCKGAGRVKLEMNFIADAYIPCDDCGGRRYGPELLDIHWNGKSIADVLEMTFEDAARFFAFHQRLRGILELMVETGLGYLTLGQTSPTLSGGEAQRLKLVTELAKGLPTLDDRKRGLVRPNLYILEEPTIGLHQSDTERLVELLNRLVDQGHTVVVIEHNLDVIAEADYVVEVGPEGGEAGGELLFQGTVEDLARDKRSPTAPFLREVLSAPAPAKRKKTRRPDGSGKTKTQARKRAKAQT